MCGRKPIYIQSLFCYGCWNTATIQEASPKAGPHIYLWRLHTEQKETFLSKITALFVSFLVSYAPSLIFHPAALYCYYMGGTQRTALGNCGASHTEIQIFIYLSLLVVVGFYEMWNFFPLLGLWRHRLILLLKSNHDYVALPRTFYNHSSIVVKKV